MIASLIFMLVVMPPLVAQSSGPYLYGYLGANEDSKNGYNAIDNCQYQNQGEFEQCAAGYFHGYLSSCLGTKYGCETHTLPELQENGIGGE